MVTFSIILPTIGRPTLARALASIRVQALAPGDEVLCVADGPSPGAFTQWFTAGLPGRYLETAARAGDWGHGPRNWAMGQARGEWLLFLDDDDTYRPGALAAVRRALASGPRRPHLFRLAHHGVGRVIWQSRELTCGNVSTQMIAAPNDPGKLGTWGARYEGDYDFIASTVAHYPEGPLWRREVIADWRTEREGALLRLREEERWRGAKADPAYNRVGGLLDLIAHAKPRTVCEVGCHRGVSTEAWLLSGCRVTAVDLWREECHFREFRTRCLHYPGLTIHQGASVEAAGFYPDRAFDCVYLDADHTYESVCADIRAWRPKCRRWIAGHDHFELFPGVSRAVKELLGAPTLFPDSSWLVEV